MPRVLFNRDFKWRVRDTVRIVYRRGVTYPVTTRCAREAIAAGAGQAIERQATQEASDARR